MASAPVRGQNRRSVTVEAFLNVRRALTGSELDDSKVGKDHANKWVLLDDGFDVPTTLADGQHDPRISRVVALDPG
jgi:hypothetical protein